MAPCWRASPPVRDRRSGAGRGRGQPRRDQPARGDIANMGFAEAAGRAGDPGGRYRPGRRDRPDRRHAGGAAPRPTPRMHQGLCHQQVPRRSQRSSTTGCRDRDARTGWPSLGVVPWFDDAWRLPAEDVMDIASRPAARCKVAVPRLGRIANFDDLDPLANEPASRRDRRARQPLPGDADLVLIPGSKSTIADLAHFRAKAGISTCRPYPARRACNGPLRRLPDAGPRASPTRTGSRARRQGSGLGIWTCHGDATAKAPCADAGHGHLPPARCGRRAMKSTWAKPPGPDCARAWLKVEGGPRARQRGWRVRGTYLHGLFASDAFRAAYLEEMGGLGLP